jgi:hypothetical protein
MRIALFHNSTFDYNGVWEKAPLSDGWVQVSGWTEVEFPPLPPQEQAVAAQLLALNKRQTAFEADFRRQRKELEEQRKALLKTGT